MASEKDSFTRASNPAFVNGTSLSFAPSPIDLFMLLPRLVQRAGSFAFVYIPEQLENSLNWAKNGGSMIAEPTTLDIVNATIATTTSAFVQGSTAPLPTPSTLTQTASEAAAGLLFEKLRMIMNFFNYMTSRWAVGALATAILLNRTQFYASQRVPLTLRWPVRLALYLLPIMALALRIKGLLEAMRCQTSPTWVGLNKQYPNWNFAAEGGFLYRLSSTLLFWQTEIDSCQNVNMLPTSDGSGQIFGSFSFLWPFFVSIGFSDFVETLACALQGRQPIQETAMTLFEHSLAFTETENLIPKDIHFEVPGTSKESFKLPRPLFTRLFNIPGEILLVAIISCLNHLTGSILAIFDLRKKYRLVNTTVWGSAYIATFAWCFWTSFLRKIILEEKDIFLWRIPTIYIIGFIPHLLIIVGISVCATIYGLALLLTALSLPSTPQGSLSLRGRLSAAYHNLQANVHLSTTSPISVKMEDDFYTSLLRIGIAIISAASEAVYLNEGPRVRLDEMTWLEEKRLQELVYARQAQERVFNSLLGDLPGGIPTDEIGPATISTASGYARERKPRGVNSPLQGMGVDTEGNSLSAGSRGWLLEHWLRFVTIYKYLTGIFWLLIALWAKVTLALFQKVGLNYRPDWLMRLSAPRGDRPKSRSSRRHGSKSPAQKAPKFWLISDDGRVTLPKDRNVDVEVETRRRFSLNNRFDYDGRGRVSEEFLDSHLYNWWKQGGWWGEVDSSGDYVPPPQEDDTTSLISEATVTTTDDEGWSDVSSDDGQRTPTRENPHPSRFRRSSTVSPTTELLDINSLASLLDPQTSETREEAKLLARHFRTPNVLTRSRHQKALQRENMRVLATNYLHPGYAKLLMPEEEEAALEQFLLERRQHRENLPYHSRAGPSIARLSNVSAGLGSTWESGAEGMGSTGPQCVVCQVSPRTILLWPCGCLSICDDCRIGLATRNFSSCVCCRTDVVAYSRLYVP